MKTTTLILDLDGVLITTPSWKADDMHADGYSDFNKNCVDNLNKLLLIENFEIWLSSTRRTKKTLKEFNQIFNNRNVRNEIKGFLPIYSSAKNRKEEIELFISQENITNYIIIDDDKSLNGLENEIKSKLIITELMKGFNQEKYAKTTQLLSDNSEYKLLRSCDDCGNKDEIKLTRLQAIFELYEFSVIWNTPCSKCKSINCNSITQNTIELDAEILDIWGENEELFLNPQDEEIILAELKYLPMLLEAIDEETYSTKKINVLIEAICILLYDNTVSPEEYSEQENIQRDIIANQVRPELIKRINKIEKAGSSVMEYVQQEIYPQIGIKLKKA
jgi:hypothetical protein